MCQIHFIYKKNELRESDWQNFKIIMSIGSVSRNDDAFGAFVTGKSVKDCGIFNHQKLDSIRSPGQKFIVGHNRFSTAPVSGGVFAEDNDNKQNHPFELGDFIMVHNGVISNAKNLFKRYNLRTKIRTDSYIIIYLVNHFFNIFTEGTREERLKKAISKTSKKIRGSYSVVIHDKKTDKSYYFKNSSTSFRFCICSSDSDPSDILLVGSTKDINLEYVYPSYNKNVIIPESNVLYSIGFDEKDGKLHRRLSKLTESSLGDTNLIKKDAMKESDGDLSNLIKSFPGEVDNFEMNEKFKIRIKPKDLLSLTNFLDKKKMKYSKSKGGVIISFNEIIKCR